MKNFIQHFASLKDCRVNRCKRHKLIDIVYITVCAIICGCKDWEAIEEFGELRCEWLKTILELPEGIPSHDTFNRVFARLDPSAVEECFVNWIKSIAGISEGSVVSIDGKRLCNSGQDGKAGIIHMVSAWSNEARMVLGQLKVSDKSNEITAIPELLKVLDLKGAVVTIDAMGCQKEIVEKIVEKKADYILAVKGNQEYLEDDIREAFQQEEDAVADKNEQIQAGHGRIEKRTCTIIRDTGWVCKAKEWKKLNTLVCIHAERISKATGKKEEQTRYYISSLPADAKTFNHAVRSHWGIENNLHWSLDVLFDEDKSMKRAGNAAQNFSVATKIALNLLNKCQDMKGTRKVSIKRKQLKCCIDTDYLQKILNGA